MLKMGKEPGQFFTSRAGVAEAPSASRQSRLRLPPCTARRQNEATSQPGSNLLLSTSTAAAWLKIRHKRPSGIARCRKHKRFHFE